MTFLPRFKSNRLIDVIPNFKKGRILIDFCDSFHYLGHIMCNKLDDRADVHREIRSIFFDVIDYVTGLVIANGR